MQQTVKTAVRIETTTVKAASFDGVQAAVLALLLFCGLFTTSVRAQVNEAFATAPARSKPFAAWRRRNARPSSRGT